MPEVVVGKDSTATAAEDWTAYIRGVVCKDRPSVTIDVRSLPELPREARARAAAWAEHGAFVAFGH